MHDGLPARAASLTSLNRDSGMAERSTGPRSATFTNRASSTVMAHRTWTHLWETQTQRETATQDSVKLFTPGSTGCNDDKWKCGLRTQNDQTATSSPTLMVSGRGSCICRVTDWWFNLLCIASKAERKQFNLLIHFECSDCIKLYRKILWIKFLLCLQQWTCSLM